MIMLHIAVFGPCDDLQPLTTSVQFRDGAPSFHFLWATLCRQLRQALVVWEGRRDGRYLFWTWLRGRRTF